MVQYFTASEKIKAKDAVYFTSDGKVAKSILGNELVTENAMELKACPFCGGKPETLNHAGWKVRCTGCGITTPDGYSEELFALDFWNTRCLLTGNTPPMQKPNIPPPNRETRDGVPRP